MAREVKYHLQWGGRAISLFIPCLSSVPLNILLRQHNISSSFSLPSACAREHGTEGMDEHRAGAKNGGMSICVNHYGQEIEGKSI